MRKLLMMAVLGMAGWENMLPKLTAAPEIDDAPEEDHAVRLPEVIQQIKITKIMEFEAAIGSGGRGVPFVVRRMTQTHFEVWTPTHGWLFDSKGKTVNEALPPRRDGDGRQWYGAFLPDGRWVTTDLWATDRTLTFFSADGKWLRERSGLQLAPVKKTDRPFGQDYADIIAWARCDRNGKGWVASIGTDNGRAIVFVGPEGKSRLLNGVTEPWDLCYPRDLEPKGWPNAWWCFRRRPSDDGQWLIRCAEYGHGEQLMNPPYQWGDKAKVRWKDGYEEVPDGHPVTGGNSNFGFLPGSHDVFIGGTEWNESSDSRTDHSGANWTVHGRPFETRFFAASGKGRGTLKGAYLTDSADKHAMWFLDPNHGVMVLGNDLKIKARLEFSSDGVVASPRKVFPDLQVGLFRVGDKFVLAKW